MSVRHLFLGYRKLGCGGSKVSGGLTLLLLPLGRLPFGTTILVSHYFYLRKEEALDPKEGQTVIVDSFFFCQRASRFHLPLIVMPQRCSVRLAELVLDATSEPRPRGALVAGSQLCYEQGLWGDLGRARVAVLSPQSQSQSQSQSLRPRRPQKPAPTAPRRGMAASSWRTARPASS